MRTATCCGARPDAHGTSVRARWRLDDAGTVHRYESEVVRGLCRRCGRTGVLSETPLATPYGCPPDTVERLLAMLDGRSMVVLSADTGLTRTKVSAVVTGEAVRTLRTARAPILVRRAGGVMVFRVATTTLVALPTRMGPAALGDVVAAPRVLVADLTTAVDVERYGRPTVHLHPLDFVDAVRVVGAVPDTVERARRTVAEATAGRIATASALRALADDAPDLAGFLRTHTARLRGLDWSDPALGFRAWFAAKALVGVPAPTVAFTPYPTPSPSPGPRPVVRPGLAGT